MNSTGFLALAATLVAVPAYAFDRETTQALQICQDYLWEVPEYADMPNAAITVFPGHNW